MTNLPDNHIDPYESRLARRVGAFAEQAVRPIDPFAVAAAAHAGARRSTLAGRLFRSGGSSARLGVILAGALVGAAVLAVYLGAGGNNGPIASGPVPTPSEVSGAPEACAAADLAGVITAWEGAAGHRIATIDVHNGGASDCLLPRYVGLALIDGVGRALIVNQSVPQPAPLTFPADKYAATMVDMANYCGAAPASPLKIRLYLDDRSSIELAAAPNVSGSVDPPPCNGPNAASEIQMQELHLK
jgi:hypothetical protein